MSTVTTLFMPVLMSNIVNNGIAKGNMEYVYTQGAIMIALAVIAIVSALINTRLNAKVSTGFSCALRKGVFQKVNSLNFDEFSSQGTAGLITRTTDDVWTLQEVSANLVYAIVATPVLFVGGIILAFTADKVLALILLGISPIVILIVWLISRKMGKLWETADKYIDIQNKQVRERLSGIRVIRSFDKEQHEHERIAVATRTMAVNIIKSNVLSGFFNPISALLLNVATVLILYLGAGRIQTEAALTAGAVIATVQYVALIMSGLMVISMVFLFLPQIKVSINRINEVFTLKGMQMGEKTGEKLSGDVKFEDVEFFYGQGGAAALSNINIDIANGEVVGIIGGTGSGKSTLMKLLMSFYPPSKGKIYLGGKDLVELSKETVRDNISIALQKAMIFQGTIEYNVRMGKKDATDEEVEKVGKIAQMQELITGNADGYKHELKEAGSNISGGQKQRINISRAVIKDAAVYVFDDSFSALDYLTESKLRKQLNKYLKGKTQLVITQRAATAMRCDKVYVMDRGTIVGVGKHAELLKNCQVYKEIYNSQLGGNVND